MAGDPILIVISDWQQRYEDGDVTLKPEIMTKAGTVYNNFSMSILPVGSYAIVVYCETELIGNKWEPIGGTDIEVKMSDE